MQIEATHKKRLKKYLTHRFHNGIFLCIYKTIKNYSDGEIHITFLNMISQVHFGTSFCHTNNTFYMTYGNRQASGRL